MDLSLVSDRTRSHLIDLETQLNDGEHLTRGQRRQLQNKRNKIKAKIKEDQQRLAGSNGDSRYCKLKADEKRYR